MVHNFSIHTKMKDIIQIIIQYKTWLLLWLGVTLKICLITWGLGILLGVLLWILSNKFKRTVGLVNNFASTVLASIPVLVLLYWIYFPLQSLFHIDIEPFTLAVSCFVVVNMFLVAKIVSGAIDHLPRQYLVSAKVVWLSKRTTVRKIKLPLIFKYVLWPIIMVQVTMMHSSIFASLINVDDIFRQVQRINALVYKPIELYTVLALFFICISVPLYILATHFRNKYSKDFSERS